MNKNSDKQKKRGEFCISLWSLWSCFVLSLHSCGRFACLLVFLYNHFSHFVVFCWRSCKKSFNSALLCVPRLPRDGEHNAKPCCLGYTLCSVFSLVDALSRFFKFAKQWIWNWTYCIICLNNPWTSQRVRPSIQLSIRGFGSLSGFGKDPKPQSSVVAHTTWALTVISTLVQWCIWPQPNALSILHRAERLSHGGSLGGSTERSHGSRLHCASKCAACIVPKRPELLVVYY